MAVGAAWPPVGGPLVIRIEEEGAEPWETSVTVANGEEREVLVEPRTSGD